jgi:Fe-S oxidoreductase
MESSVTEKVKAKMIPVYIMGKKYEVPEALTIMKAMEYAGYQYIRGCGCRGGVCGACSTVYRKAGDYKIYAGLACQTVVEPDMYLTQIPFYPANRAQYDYAAIKPEPEEIHKLYPELFRCVACNACTKICPMDVEVLDYISHLKRGDITGAARISFDCIQCGLCASRCFGEIPQYHAAQLARRLQGGKIAPKAEHMAKMVEDIDGGKFQEGLAELKGMSEEELKKAYTSREMEPAMSDESWQPEDRTGLVS